MNKMMEKIIEKSGKQLCEVAKISAAISVNSCRGDILPARGTGWSKKNGGKKRCC